MGLTVVFCNLPFCVCCRVGVIQNFAYFWVVVVELFPWVAVLCGLMGLVATLVCLWV